jgi:hypothetical protein
MGYESIYRIKMLKGEFAPRIFNHVFEGETGYSAYFNDNQKEFITSGKWYDWKDDFPKISSLFPDVVFEITRYGEQQPDIERAFFKNGMMYQLHQPKIVFEEFNENIN